MSFSDQAIGFYLQLEDELTPALPKAEAAYAKFVKALDAQNKSAFLSMKKGFADLGGLVTGFGKMTDDLTKNYAKAVKQVQNEAKPITQRIDLTFTTRSIASLRKQVGEAIGKALASASIRLTATTPVNRLKMFDTSATLRTLYKDVPQPPDMKGRFSIPGFGKGGKVKGKEGSGSFDSVIAALTPGEVVLPVNLVKSLERFDKGMKKQGKLKGLLDAGLGTPNDIKKHAKIMGDLAEELSTISAKSKNLSVDLRHRIAPGLIDATKKMEELGKETEETNKASNKLMDEGLGAAKFLGLHKALQSVQGAFNALRSKASSAFTTLGGNAIGAGIDSLNQMNQHLGLSRDRLAQVKARAATLANELDGVTFDELAHSMKVAAEAGIKNEDTMIRLAKAASLVAKGTDVAAGSAVSFGFEYTGALGGTQEGFEDLLGSMANLSSAQSGLNTSASKLMADTQADIKILGSTLADLTGDESQGVIDSFNRMGASLDSAFIKGGDIRQILAGAFRGGKDDIEAMNKAFHLTGMNTEQLRESLKKGDLDGIFSRIGTTVRDMKPEQLATFASSINITANDLKNFDKQSESLNANLVGTRDMLVQVGDGLKTTSQRAEANRTWFQKLQEAFTDSAGAMTVFGVQGSEVMDFFKEFNIASLLAVGFLGKMAIGFVATAAKAGLYALTLGKVSLFTKATAAAGAAGGGGGRGGLGGLGKMFKGLGAGLSAFGKAMIGPGGLGLIALVAGLIGIGFAAKLAAPMMEALAPVLVQMVKSFAVMFNTLTKMKAGDIAKFGLALVPVAAGVTLLGVSFAAAAVGMGAFMAVMALGNLSGKGVVGVLESMVGDLGRLGTMQSQLKATAAGLRGAAHFLVEFAAVGAILAGLGALSVISGLVTSFLGFFGMDSPLKQLSDEGAAVADTLLSLAGSLAPLDAVSKDAAKITAGLTASTQMVRALGPLVKETIRLGAQASGLKDGWFTDGPLTKIGEQSRPMVKTLNKIARDFSGLNVSSGGDKLRQARDMLRDMSSIVTFAKDLASKKMTADLSTSLTQSVVHKLVSPKQIEQVISATIAQRGKEDPVVQQMMEANRLLMKLVELMMAGNTDRKENKPQPAPVAAARSSIVESVSTFND